MKLGLGLGAGMLTGDNLQFAKQVGATHIVAHLPDEQTLPTGAGYWQEEDLVRLREQVEDAGLKLEAIENFPPRHWDQVLLGGPGRSAQIENLKRTIRNMGRARIPCMGYYFSLAGVWGRTRQSKARGGAMTVVYDPALGPAETPIPLGEVWGQKVTDVSSDGDIGTVSHDEMWERLAFFLREMVPVAEESGVRLAAHPDDPPMPTLRGTARLITHPDHYQRLLDLVPSYSNGLEFCQGTIAEMGHGVYNAIRQYAGQGKIVYVHFRNVRGAVPHFEEVFLDEGDVDMIEAMRLYRDSGFDGVMIPDHTPSTTCAAPWHAGMAYALGYMRATLNCLARE